MKFNLVLDFNSGDRRIFTDVTDLIFGNDYVSFVLPTTNFKDKRTFDLKIIYSVKLIKVKGNRNEN